MIEIYKECLFNRYYEYKVAEFLNKKIVKPPVYLSVGTEYIPVLLKRVLKDLNIKKYNIFAQHRCHSYHLSFIEDPIGLGLELCGSPKGCNKGYGGSASISGKKDELIMFGHDGLLGSNAPIATGFSQSSNELTICILGDAAVEEDYVLGSLGWAATKKSKILFIIEDNDLSLLTTKKERRSWDICKVANSFGLLSRKDTFLSLSDKLKSLKKDIKKVNNNNPLLINFDVYRHFWHAGSGNDGPPKYDYISTIEEQLKNQNIDLNLIKQEQQIKINEIWNNIEIELEK